MLQAVDLSKEYPTPSGPLPILSGVNLSLKPGEAAAITGPSGSGKSSLLYILGALEPPTAGTFSLNGQNPYQLDESALASFRNKHIGFVFQDHCLLPQCSVIENVLAPTLVAGKGNHFETRARKLLDDVGLGARLHHRPAELSGGEKQRAALARALILDPALVLCDEPTGNLDRASAESVASLLIDLHRSRQSMLLVVTHSPDLAARFPVRYELQERKLCRH